MDSYIKSLDQAVVGLSILNDFSFCDSLLLQSIVDNRFDLSVLLLDRIFLSDDISLHLDLQNVPNLSFILHISGMIKDGLYLEIKELMEEILDRKNLGKT